MVSGSRPRAWQLAKYFLAAAASVTLPEPSGKSIELCADTLPLSQLNSSSASRGLRFRCASTASRRCQSARRCGCCSSDLRDAFLEVLPHCFWLAHTQGVAHTFRPAASDEGIHFLLGDANKLLEMKMSRRQVFPLAEVRSWGKQDLIQLRGPRGKLLSPGIWRSKSIRDRTLHSCKKIPCLG